MMMIITRVDRRGVSQNSQHNAGRDDNAVNSVLSFSASSALHQDLRVVHGTAKRMDTEEQIKKKNGRTRPIIISGFLLTMRAYLNVQK